MIIFCLPVYNEERELAQNTLKLRDFLITNIKEPWEIVIVDNGSRDNTLKIAQDLNTKHADISYIHLDLKGRGRAIKKCWQEKQADIYSYMDIDLSTDLRHILAMIAAIKNGKQIAIGNRLMPTAHIRRGLKRNFLSKNYNRLLRFMFNIKFTDAQCGFKFINNNTKKHLLPLVEDNNWFFDSELLILAERTGYSIHEEPVNWVNDADTRVKLLPTILNDLGGIWRLKFKKLR